MFLHGSEPFLDLFVPAQSFWYMRICTVPNPKGSYESEQIGFGVCVFLYSSEPNKPISIQYLMFWYMRYLHSSEPFINIDILGIRVLVYAVFVQFRTCSN